MNMKGTKLGKNIKFLRRLSGLNQTAFARAFETSQSRISEYETGKRLPPTELLIRLADEYQVSFDWLFTGEINPEKSFR